MSEFICPRCNGPLACLGGCSAHESNWYCKDEDGCGWQAWDIYHGTRFGKLPPNGGDYKLTEMKAKKHVPNK